MEETVKILVVDDDEVDRIAVRRALVAAGVKMDLSETTGCAEAIALLQQQQFDCSPFPTPHSPLPNSYGRNSQNSSCR
jgi:CheY-like chemotaxis protein